MPDYQIFADSKVVVDNFANNKIQGRDLVASVTYEADASVDEIVEFYSRYGECTISDVTSNIACQASTSTQDIDYFVYIDSANIESAASVEYTVQINWTGCVWSLTLY